MKDVLAIINEKIKVDAIIKMIIRDFRNTISMLAKVLSGDDVIDFLIEIFNERR